MLKLPSEILEAWQVPNLRGYGVMVYRKLVVSRDRSFEGTRSFDESLTSVDTSHPSLFASAFIEEKHARAILEKVHQQAEKMLDVVDEPAGTLIILPPLFMRSDDEFILKIKAHMHLVATSNGPIIPILTYVDESTLSSIIDVYGIVSPHYFNRQTAARLLHNII